MIAATLLSLNARDSGSYFLGFLFLFFLSFITTTRLEFGSLGARSAQRFSDFPISLDR